jgi:hypothetical protein
MSTNIELSKARDFGEIISDSFLFIRENFKPLLKCFFIFCGFFMVATVVVSWMQQSKVIGALNNFDPNSYSSGSNPFGAMSQYFGIEYVLVIVFAFLNGTAMTVTVISYMAVYKAKGNMTPTTEEVWGYIKFYFLTVFGSSILIAILLAIALVCCIIPFFYFFPIFALIFPIMIVENTGFGYAFSQSFKLIRDNFWVTFGALIVVVIVVYILAMIIVLPLSAANIGSLFLHRGKGMHLSPVLTLLTTALSELSHVFYILPIVASVLCYFNLNELKEGTGLMDRINQLGANKADTNLPAEEY